MSRFEDLKSKLVKVRDLRHAIKEFRQNSGLQKNVEPAPMAPASSSKSPDNALKHLKIVNNPDGSITHILGKENDSTQYHVHADMGKMARKEPAYSIDVLSEGKHSGRSPEFYSTIKQAVNALLNFEKHKKW